ncbi:MAG: cytochrome-c peroxidase [Flavobacteriales bacterium]|nr:MAG: cytochrome-c peroxidase [Flavobacteriales bacterium]
MKTFLHDRTVLIALGSMALLAVNCGDEDPDPPSGGGGTGGPTAYALDIPNNLPPMLIPMDNPMTVEGVALGRHLFYEEKLSNDNMMSCASCHAQIFGFTDNGNAFSEGIDGIAGERNAMALINLGWGNSFFWDGRAPSLEKQVLEPVINPIEMHETWPDAIAKLSASSAYQNLFTAAFGGNSLDSVHAAKALAQFLRTMISANSPYDRWKRGEGTIPLEAQLGYDLFKLEGGFPPFIPNGQGGADCFHCHTDGAGLFTDEQFHNNALQGPNPTDEGVGAVTGDPFQIGHFKTPTLRNIAVTGPYMHDGRFATLQEVIDHYNEGGEDSPTVDAFMKFVDPDETMELTPQKKAQVIAFLEQLTDTAFLTNPAFSDPGPP